MLLRRQRPPTPPSPGRCLQLAHEHQDLAVAVAATAQRRAERFVAEVRADTEKAMSEATSKAQFAIEEVRAHFQTELRAAAEENISLAQRTHAAVEAREETREQCRAELRAVAEEQAVLGHRLELQLRTVLQAHEANAQAAAEASERLKLELRAAAVERQQAQESEEAASLHTFGLQEELARAEERIAQMQLEEQRMGAWHEGWILEG